MAGNAFHHLFLSEYPSTELLTRLTNVVVVEQYKDAYPTAKTIGPEDLNAKKAAEGWQLDAGEGASIRSRQDVRINLDASVSSL